MYIYIYIYYIYICTTFSMNIRCCTLAMCSVLAMRCVTGAQAAGRLAPPGCCNLHSNGLSEFVFSVCYPAWRKRQQTADLARARTSGTLQSSASAGSVRSLAVQHACIYGLYACFRNFGTLLLMKRIGTLAWNVALNFTFCPHRARNDVIITINNSNNDKNNSSNTDQMQPSAWISEVMWHLQDIIHVKSRRNCGAFCDKW